MSMTLTILCDNSVEARAGLIGEHGFSCHIQTAGKQYLFDTGNGLGLLNNARCCDIDLKEIDAVLLSHGHWDHCDGLMPLLQLRAGRATPVYAHPAIFTDRVNRRDGQERKTGAGFTRAEAEAAGAVFHLAALPLELPGGLIFSGEIPRQTDEYSDANLWRRQEGELTPDPLLDDQSLYLQGGSGLTVLCGCAHAGIRNTIRHALEQTGAKNLHGLVGGLHLMFSDREQETMFMKEIEPLKPQLLALSHCTGPRAVSRLMNRYDSIVASAAVGRSFQL